MSLKSIMLGTFFPVVQSASASFFPPKVADQGILEVFGHKRIARDLSQA